MQVSVQLRLSNKVKNSFEYCEVHLPFFHRLVTLCLCSAPWWNFNELSSYMGHQTALLLTHFGLEFLFFWSKKKKKVKTQCTAWNLRLRLKKVSFCYHTRIFLRLDMDERTMKYCKGFQMDTIYLRFSECPFPLPPPKKKKKRKKKKVLGTALGCSYHLM